MTLLSVLSAPITLRHDLHHNYAPNYTPPPTTNDTKHNPINTNNQTTNQPIQNTKSPNVSPTLDQILPYAITTGLNPVCYLNTYWEQYFDKDISVVREVCGIYPFKG